MRKLLNAFCAVCMSVVMAFSPVVAYADEVVQPDAEGGATIVTEGEGAGLDVQAGDAGTVESIVAKMTLDEKLSQMIIVAIRTWDEKNVTDLSANPQLAEALQKHQYGGVILFGQNIVSNAQAAKLVQQLQDNNKVEGVSREIPYFIAADEEGGIVTRLTGGTRMTGSMAIGATGANSEENAWSTGRILGSELQALGINVNFAPSIDVNSNPDNPAIGTRSFSEDPETVADLGISWLKGHAESGTMATLKHFPGGGDAASDPHLGLTTVNKTYEELKACELVPFKTVIDYAKENPDAYNVDMIMTAHVTLPKYDDQVEFPDGKMDYYPATMSHKVLTELLREELGYDGVIVTDALEMGAISGSDGESAVQLVDGAKGSDEYAANIAEKVINAGADILLIPRDLLNAEAITFYDNYLDALKQKVQAGTISEARINESVTRILKLKEKYGLLEKATPTGDITTVGSDAHHAEEERIAREAITLVKNSDNTLPASGHDTKIVFAGRTATDNSVITYAIDCLKRDGLMPEDAYVNNLVTGKKSGSETSTTKITIDYTYDFDKKQVHYTDELKAAVKEANLVAGIGKTYALGDLKKGAPQYEAVHSLIDDVHAGGGKYVYISGNLPYDAARYTDADAALLAYMGTGVDIDPTSRADGSANVGAFNANLYVAIMTVFDDLPPVGTLPVTVPTVREAADGTLSYTQDTLYARGFGLNYEYRFTEGAGGKHKIGTNDVLAFKNTARWDKLVAVKVDGKAIDPSNYTKAAGSTILTLKADYLNTLAASDHTLTSVYDYGNGFVPEVSTNFTIEAANSKPSSSSSSSSSSPSPSSSSSSARTTLATTNRTTSSSTPTTGDNTPNFVIGIVIAIALIGGGLFLRSRKHE